MNSPGAPGSLRRAISGSALALISAACVHNSPRVEQYDYEVIRDQIYAQRVTGDLKGDLYLPATDRPAPGLVMIHGGGWRRGDVRDMSPFARRAAASGFAVFNVSYRLAPRHKFPAQLEDVRQAVRWLRSRAAQLRVDPDRIGAWGYSAGAHLAMLLGTLDDDALPDGGPNSPSARVSAVIAGAGPTDLRRYPDNKYVAALMPAHAGEELYALASPIAAVSSDDASMFLYHGRTDVIVGYGNSADMLQALSDAGVAARLYELRFGHILTYFFGGDAVDAAIEFLRQHLGEPSG